MADLTDLERVKRYLDESPADSTLDARLTELIKSASAWFEAQIGGEVLASEKTETYDGDGSTRIMLDRFPVVSVKTVTVDGVEVTARATTSGDGYVIHKETGRLDLVGSRFNCGTGNVSVTYTAGLAAVPEDVKEAVAARTVILYKDPKRVGLQSASVSGESVTYDGNRGVLAFVESVVSSYRKVTAG